MTRQPSSYRLQIVHVSSGRVVSWAPGLEVETDLIADLVARVGTKAVGLGRTTATVQAAVGEAFEELLADLKARV